MKNISLIVPLVIVFFINNNSFAQNISPEDQRQIDSLNSIINNPASADSSLARAYVRLSEILYSSNIDTIAFLCQKAKIITEKALAKNPDKITTKSLQQSLASALNNIGFVYDSQGDIPKALEYWHKSLKIQEELGDKSGIAISLNNIGYVYNSQGDIPKALEYYHKSLKIEEELGDKEGIAISLNNIGSIYNSQGDISKALEYWHKSLKIREELGDKEGIATSLNNIGYVYNSQGDIPKALEYWHKSLKIEEELGDKSGIATSLNNIGSIYNNQGDIPRTLAHWHKSLKIREEIGDKAGTATSLNNIGYVYNSQGDIPKALEYYHKSLKIQEELGDKSGIASSLTNIGNLQFDQGNIYEAQKNGLKSLAIAQEIGYPEKIRNAAHLLSRIYEKQGKGMQAYKMYKLYATMKDSINNEETLKVTVKQQAKYEYEKQALADSITNAEAMKVQAALLKSKEAENKQHKLEAQQQKQQKYFLFGGLTLMVLFATFVFNRLRVTQKQKAIIEAQKEQVEIAHKETERQKKVVEQQKEYVEEQHKEITDSINYAKRLQNAILPSFASINEHIPDNFVLFQPKDVVSGDFYWFEHKNNISYLAAADCTGHGVPGAMVSVVCANALNRSVNEFKITAPAKILDKTRELVIETFAKSGDNVKDGMDIALCAIYNDKVVFSGANNPLWIVRQKEYLTSEQLEHRSTCINGSLALIEYKADKQPVGLYEDMKPFTQTEITLFEGDSLYLFSDGFADQFGGEKGKKFKYKPFKRKIIEISIQPMEEQKEIIQTTFNNWKGDLEQVDDVCIIGMRV